VAGTLDGTNGVPAGSEDDVAMAMAWDFALNAGETAYISFLISDALPAGGFYLTQSDPDSLAAIHLSSGLSIRQGGQAPEPATLALVGWACWRHGRCGAEPLSRHPFGDPMTKLPPAGDPRGRPLGMGARTDHRRSLESILTRSRK